MEEEDLFRDINVLSMEQATTLPYLTYRLTVEGMTVIRLEHPLNGDPNRLVGKNVLGEERMNNYFFPNNVGKKAITLNLGGDEGKAILHQLITRLPVDIFCTNQLPTSYKKLGIDYETLSAVKPDLIWLGITGFGPDSSEAAYDPVLQARSGLMDLTGEPDGPPMISGLPLVNIGSAEHGFSQIMKALFKRQAMGQGSRIDISMFQSVVSWMVNPVMLTRSFDTEITRRGNTHRFFAPASVFKAKDAYMYMAVGNDRQWEAITRLPGFEGLARPEYRTNAGRIADVERLNRELNQVFGTKTADELLGAFREIGVPISKVNTVRDVVEDPYIKPQMITARDPRTGLEVHLPPPPVITPYLESVNYKMRFPPRMGEHNEEIYGGVLGYSTRKLAGLREQGVI
ncbi:MAG: CaiB/BaiF CoA transferase family protein [Anaerolineae bacterium]